MGDHQAHPVLIRAFRIAAADGGTCRPVHLARALAEDDGGAGHALRPMIGPPITDDRRGGGATSSYLLGQIQAAATEFAALRGERRAAAHLAVAMLDQREPEMARALADAGIDLSTVRRAALAELGAQPDLPLIPMPPLTPAGTLDRPALNVDELHPRAWRALVWRQDHLPVAKIRRASHLAALESLEKRAAWRVADTAAVDDDQRYSLLDHHRRAVEERIAPIRARFDQPQLVRRGTSGWTPGRRRHLGPRFMIGWGTWFGNRRAGLRDRWFRLATARAYRDQPRLD